MHEDHPVILLISFFQVGHWDVIWSTYRRIQRQGSEMFLYYILAYSQKRGLQASTVCSHGFSL